MADTGEDRQIRPQVEAHESEAARESKELDAKISQAKRDQPKMKRAGVHSHGRRKRKG